MAINSEQDVLRLIRKDPWMMDIIRSASRLNLNDWCVCAGFVRSKIWDSINGKTVRTELSDIDVVYFDIENTDERMEKEFEIALGNVHPGLPWSVKNQARMHKINEILPYISTEDAISKFPETATALGVTIDEAGNLKLIAPHGIQDALNMIIRPTPFFTESKSLMKIFEKRLESKNWPSIWPGIKIAEKEDVLRGKLDGKG
jgi:uncharacterized protein